MSLPIPSLDDRDFDKLYEEAMRLIPRYCPVWTDHNPSDPGIQLAELFAFLFDAKLYQMDQLSEQCYEHFAELFHKNTLDEAVYSLGEVNQAVTAEDFEQLLLTDYNAEIRMEEKPGKRNTIARVWVCSSVHKGSQDKFMNVVIIPSLDRSYAPSPTSKDCQSVFTWLRKRCPITTKLEVIGPEYISFDLEVTVAKNKDTLISYEDIRKKIEFALGRYLSPLHGGMDGLGWPFGKSIYRSELFKLIEEIDGVDYVKDLRINGNSKLNEVTLSPVTLIDIANYRGDGYAVNNLKLWIVED